MLFIAKILLDILGIGVIIIIILLGITFFNAFYIDKRDKEKAYKISETMLNIYAYLFFGEFILVCIEIILTIIATILGYK